MSKGFRLVMATGLVAGGFIALPVAAQAAAVPQCNGQDKTISQTVSLDSENFVLTHAKIVGLGAGISYSTTTTVTKVNQVKVSATGAWEVTGGMDWKVAKLDAKVTYGLAVEGQHSSTNSISETFNVPARNTTQQILFAEGWTKTTGTWKNISCSRQPGNGTISMGKVHSYKNVPWTAAFECKRSKYGTSTNFYKAAVQAGCP